MKGDMLKVMQKKRYKWARAHKYCYVHGSPEEDFRAWFFSRSGYAYKAFSLGSQSNGWAASGCPRVGFLGEAWFLGPPEPGSSSKIPKSQNPQIPKIPKRKILRIPKSQNLKIHTNHKIPKSQILPQKQNLKVLKIPNPKLQIPKSNNLQNPHVPKSQQSPNPKSQISQIRKSPNHKIPKSQNPQTPNPELVKNVF